MEGSAGLVSEARSADALLAPRVSVGWTRHKRPQRGAALTNLRGLTPTSKTSSALRAAEGVPHHSALGRTRVRPHSQSRR